MPQHTPAVRRCADCEQHKPTGDFYVYRSGTFYTRCKPCHYTYTQAWRAKNRHKVRALDRERYPRDQARKIAAKRLRKYGLSQPQYDAMVERQGGVCPICLEPLVESTLGMDSGDWSIPSVDHCHETGTVRGILHRRCNLAIEFLLPDDAVARARRYLRDAGGQPDVRQAPPPEGESAPGH